MSGTTPRPGMGAIVHEEGVAFRLWAPNADAVFVAGDMNDWSAEAAPMAAEGDGHWYADLLGARAGQEYQYVIHANGEQLWRVDPRARQVTNSVGNGIIVDPGAFDWQGDDFACPPHHELVIYETHTGSFTSSWGDGDLAGLTSRLGYLRDLGINALELMPVMEFAGDRSWGYNPAHIFAVESGYGGPEALRTLVREAHKAGIAVLVDVVYNHFGPSDLDLWQLDGWSENGKGGIYFYNDHRAATPWGDTRPDYGRPQVRDLIRDHARMWLEEYHVDGLRLDMTPFMYSVNGSSRDLPDGWSAMRMVADAVHEIDPGALVVAEDLRGDPLITDRGPEGAGMNAQWCERFVHPLRRALGQVDDAHRDLHEVAQAITHRYGDDAFARVVYTESHDEVANGRARVPQEVDPANPTGWQAQKRATLGAAIALTSPGIPMLFQGQEFLEDEWFRDTVPLDWGRAEQLRDVVRLFRDLIALRRNTAGETAGLTGQRTEMLLVDDAARLLAWHRATDDGRSVLVAANLSAEAASAEVGLPGDIARWSVRFNSDAATYSALFGDHPTPDIEVHDGRGTVDVGPYSLVVWVPA